MIELHNGYLAREMQDPQHAAISGNIITWKVGDVVARGFIVLPPGSWQIVCTSKEATEAQAESIVQVISNGKISGMPQYRRYDRDPVKDTPARSWTRDARHALETLLASKGCDLNKNWLILKKK